MRIHEKDDMLFPIHALEPRKPLTYADFITYTPYKYTYDDGYHEKECSVSVYACDFETEELLHSNEKYVFTDIRSNETNVFTDIPPHESYANSIGEQLKQLDFEPEWLEVSILDYDSAEPPECRIEEHFKITLKPVDWHKTAKAYIDRVKDIEILKAYIYATNFPLIFKS